MKRVLSGISFLVMLAWMMVGCVHDPIMVAAPPPPPVVVAPVEQPQRQGLDEVYQVTAAVQGANSYALMEVLENEAKKQAIVKYMQRHNIFQDVKILQEAANEYGRFVKRYRALETPKWTPLGGVNGQLSATYQIELDVASINRWLQTKGMSNQGGIELVIMEEAPSLGQMRMYGELKNFMVNNYTMMQRSVRDAILKKVAEYGFDVKLLEDNPSYAEFKDKDQGLMGTYYDVDRRGFTVHKGLLDAIRGNSPEAFVLMYRIDSLIWDNVANDVRSTVSVNVKCLRNNVTKNFGRAVLQFPTSGHNVEKAFDDLGNCVSRTVCSLFNSEEAGRKLNELIMGMKNQQLVPQAPIRLVVNANAFAPTIRKRALYTMKRVLIQSGVVLGQPLVTNLSVSATINPAKYADSQSFAFEFVVPAIKQNFGMDLSDEQINFDGNNVIIKAGGSN